MSHIEVRGLPPEFGQFLLKLLASNKFVGYGIKQSI